MNKTIEALKLAEAYIAGMKWSEEADEALAAIREALAEPVKQESKKWVDLTSEEYEMLCQGNAPMNIRVRTVAMALKNKNLGD